MKPCKTLFGLLLVALSAISAQGLTIHVPAEQATIATGLSVAATGDTVLVACGTYDEWDLSMPSGVTLRGATGDPECVIIDGNGNSRMILLENTLAGTRIEELTITGGHFAAGSGLYFWGAVGDVSDCIIRDNSGASTGSGCCVRYASAHATFRRCRFLNNHSEDVGGAIYLSATSLTVEDCTFRGNSAADDGAALFCYDSNAILIGCTMDDNTVDQFGGGIVASLGDVTLIRCIVSNSGDGCAVYIYSGSSIILDCCNLYNNPNGNWTAQVADQFGLSGNICQDPQYCGIPGSGNYYLQSDSPCAPENSGCGERIGAWEVGCEETAADLKSWGEIKSLY